MAALRRTINTCALSSTAPHRPSAFRAAQASLIRAYATHTSTGSGAGANASAPRKQISVTSDDGRVRWSDLSAREKAARTTQQSINLLVVLAGVAMTGAIATFLYLDVFSTDSKTSIFNKTFERIRKDDRCIELLGDSKAIAAFGDGSLHGSGGWRRHRPLAARVETDKFGTEHMHMHFNVRGPLNGGIVHVHMTKRPSESQYEYRYLSLDVPGHQRIWLENADEKGDKRAPTKMFGVRWW